MFLGATRVLGVLPGDAEFHPRTWTTDDGLPHNSVNALLQDSVGFMWFATGGGLARFDGREFTEMRAPPAFQQSGFNIRSIAEEEPGVLIVVPAGSSVLRLARREWSVHPVTAELAERNEAPTAVHVDAARNIWIGTGAGRILCWSPQRQGLAFDTGGRVVSAGRKLSFVTDATGRTWINADKLWFADSDGAVVPLTFGPDEPRVLGPGQSNRVWVLTRSRLHRLEDGRVAGEIPLPEPLNLTGVRHLYEDKDGAIWIATSRQGLLRLDEGRLKRVSPYPSVNYVTEDREGNLWAATDGSGVGQLREKSYQLFNTASGLGQDVVSSVAEDSTGRIWLANRSGGVSSVDAAGAVQRTLSGPAMFANVVIADREDRIWFGGGRNGLLRWTPGAEAPEKMPLPASDLHVLLRARNGDVWFAADTGEVGFYHDGEARLIGDRNALGAIWAVAEDADGVIWLGGRHGDLFRWDGSQLERNPIAGPSSRAPIHTIHADADNRLWIGTARGLLLRLDGRLHLLTQRDGLLDEIIQALVSDRLGNLWFASRRGLFHAAKADLIAAARDPQRRIECHRLGPNQGLIGLTPTPTYQPIALRARTGALWFATAQGAVMVDPSRLPRDLPTPPVLVDEIRVDGVPVVPVPELKIRSSHHRLEFRFAALSYTVPEGVVLRHRLDGVDQQWIETPVDRSASYTNLPPGTYRLHVIARNSSGRWNREGATLGFTIVPAWWETAAFRIAAALVLVFLIAAAARTIAQRRLRERLRRLEQQHALEKERSRIARDLHDELGAGLTEVGLLADRLVTTAPQDLAGALSGLAWRTRRLATDLSGIVWTMNANHSSLDHLAAFLRRYAERLFRNTGIRCLVEGVEAIPAIPLAPEIQHQLLAATKEALNNVVKHAHATQARIELRYAADTFVVLVQDDGIGYAADEPSDGNGLRNMRARLEECGGAFRISARIGAGTEVEFRVRCGPAAISPDLSCKPKSR